MPGNLTRSLRLSWLAVVAVALAPLGLWLLLEQQRPFPFTTTNDNWSYFLPLMTRVTDAWLDGHPLRVVWELGQGWSPWDSGQVGWLSPLPVVAALIAHAVGDPLALLEIDAALHLLVLGFAAVWAPPLRITGGGRLVAGLLLGLMPGPILVGMNWHDYLTPAPWFLFLLGFCWRAVDEDEPWSAGRAVGVVVCSLLFFSAAHPQMVVLGCAFLTLFVATTAKRSSVAVDVVARLACAFLAAVPALFYLWWAAAQAAPVWRAVRNDGSLFEKVYQRLDALGALALGHAFVGKGAAFFLPLVFVVLVRAVARQQPRLILGCLFVVVVVAPAVFPPIEHIFVGPLASFRFPVKLMVYAGPVVGAWFLHQGGRFRAVAFFSACASFFVILSGNNGFATLDAAHAEGAPGLVALGEVCLDEAGVAPGERIAFVDRIDYDRTFEKVPPFALTFMNHAALTLGRETVHVYEPLEPEDLHRAHGNLTAFWRSKPLRLDARNERWQQVRDSGAQWLLGLEEKSLAPLPAVAVCGLWVAPMPDGHPLLPPDIERSPAGVLTTTKAQEKPPDLHLARALTWQRLDDGRWRAVPPLPEAKWIVSTLAFLALSLLLVRHRLPLLPLARRTR